MSRILGAIVYNWPLKLAALALATLLYAGLIFSENATSRDVGVPIQAVNAPANTILIGDLGEVTSVRVFVSDPTNVVIGSANFSATVDLSRLEPGPETQSVRVTVMSADPRIQVLANDPQFVSVRLEKVVPSEVPVEVLPGTVPDGLAIGDPKPSISRATVLGAQSDVARVAVVRATIPIDTSGIDIDRDFALTAVDQLGEPVRGVEVDPPTVHVTMAVFKDRRTATVPIAAPVVGAVAPGFEVASVTTAVPTITIEGDPEDLANVPTVATVPISVDGRSADFDATVAFDLPTGVSVVGDTTVRVHVTIRPVTGSRTFSVGIALTGARPDRVYVLSAPQALLIVGGSTVDLDRLTGSTLVLTAAVGELDPGTHAVDLGIELPAGLTVVGISPAQVTVTVSVPASAAPSVAPSASGGG